MTVTLKTPEDIAKMRVAGKLAAEVLEMIAEYVKPGVTTEELDRICHDYIVNVQKAIPGNVGYHGFPKTASSASGMPSTSSNRACSSCSRTARSCCSARSISASS